MDTVITKLFETYRLHPTKLLAPQKGYRNTSWAAVLPDGMTVNLVIYKTEPGTLKLVQNANSVADFLAKQGLPVRQTFDKRIVCLNTGSSATKRYASLYTYLPGHTIPWEGYTRNHLKAVGMTLGVLHRHLAKYEGRLPSVCDLLAQQLRSMVHYFDSPGVQTAMAAKLKLAAPRQACEALQKVLVVCKNLPNQQALQPTGPT